MIAHYLAGVLISMSLTPAELTETAAARRILEDGRNRPSHQSCPGIGTHNLGRRAVEYAGVVNPKIVTDSNGERFFLIEGHDSHRKADKAVEYVLKALVRNEKDSVRRADQRFGPGGDKVQAIRKELQSSMSPSVSRR